MLFVTLAILASENVKALNHQMETEQFDLETIVEVASENIAGTGKGEDEKMV